MRIPFTIAEVRKAVFKLKPGKSPGCDDIPVELIKYAPDEILQHITDIFNQIASNGECPTEINHSIHIPLQKLGKLREPVVNLRPIILLSTIRKILAVVMMRRIGEKLDRETPITQAAYQGGRSTEKITEHVFACL